VVRAGLSRIEAVGRLDVKSVKLQARGGVATELVVVGPIDSEDATRAVFAVLEPHIAPAR
jgi:hypothetical protein